MFSANKLLPIYQIIKLARQKDYDWGKGDPKNRLRYYTKIGLLPHAERKQLHPDDSHTVGHYPAYVIDLLLKIQNLKNTGKSPQKIKLQFEKEKIIKLRSESTFSADQLLPIYQIINLTRQKEYNWGKGDPKNRLRYYTKIGLLPHAERKQLHPSDSHTVGHYPAYVIDLLLKIQNLKNAGQPLKEIKLQLEAEKLTQKAKAAVAQGALPRSLTHRVKETFITTPPRRFLATAAGVFTSFILLTVGLFAFSKTPIFNQWLAQNPFLSPVLDRLDQLEQNLQGKTLGDQQPLPVSSPELVAEWTIPFAPSLEPPNLLKNSSFEANESRLSGGSVAFWQYVSQSGNNNTKTSQISARTGNLGLEFYDSSEVGQLGLIQSATKTVNGRDYTFSVWLTFLNSKPNPDLKLRLGLFGTVDRSKDPNGALMTDAQWNKYTADKYQDLDLSQTIVKDDQTIWHQYTADFTNLPLGKSPIIQLMNYQGEHLVLDDISLTTNDSGVDTNSLLGYATIMADSTASIYPVDPSQSTAYLGLKDNRWQKLYVQSIDASADALINGKLTIHGDVSLNNSVSIADFNSDLLPETDNTYDLGSSTKEWKDLYLDGTAYLDTLAVHESAEIADNLVVQDNTTLGDSATDETKIHGLTYIGDGGTTDYAYFSPTGDLTFFGAADTITSAGHLIIQGDGSGTDNLTIQQYNNISITASSELSLSSSDWAISATGDLTNIGSITADGTIATTDLLQIGATAPSVVVYNFIADDLVDASSEMDSDLDIYFQGDVEIDGSLILGDSGGDLLPSLDNQFDIGSAAKRWNDGFFGGQLHLSHIASSSGEPTVSLRPNVYTPDLRKLYDGVSSYTDDTGDMMADTNDYKYYGFSAPFSGVYFIWSQAGNYGNLWDAGGDTGTLEYWNGAWTEITFASHALTDGTSDFTTSGSLYFQPPSDWASTSVDSEAGYWIRISTSSVNTQAIASTENILPDGYAIAAYLSPYDTTPTFYVDYRGDVQVATLLISQDLQVTNYVKSNLIPSANDQYDLGSSTYNWDQGYFREITADNIIATQTEIGGTISATFSINTDATGDEDASLVFTRTGEAANAIFGWAAATDDFTLNSSLILSSTIDNPAILEVPGNIDTTGGDIQTNSTTRIDNAGNLTYIADITFDTGADRTITGPGAGAVLIIDNSTNLILQSASGNVGIGTTNPQTTFHINATDGLVIPVGTVAERSGTPTTGTVRYNSENQQFEGYGTSTWGSLGGVTDVDQDTYISAENSPGDDNDELKFYTANSLNMFLSSTGNLGIGTTVPQNKLDVAGSVAIGSLPTNPLPQANSLYVSGNVGIGTTDPSYLLEVDGAGLVGGVYLNSSDVGLTTDIDLISLANDAVTVNGTLTSTGALAGSTVTDGTTTFSDSAWTSSSAIAWNLASSTTALNIEDGLLNLDTASSKVGIGTTDPSSLFSVGSSSQFQVDSNGDIVSLGGVAHTLVDTSGDLVITGNGDLAFDDHTLSSAVDLSVADAALNASLTQGIIDAINDIYDLSTGGAGALWLDGGDYAYLNTSLASNIQVIEDSWLGISSSTERIIFDGTGGDISFIGANIGIGTTIPQNKLDVSGSVAIGSLPTNPLPQANSLYVSGNVGIGTTDPSYLLEVDGAGLVGGVYLNSSDVGLTTDADLISLANDAVTVNGTLTSTGALAGSTVTDGTTTFSDSAWTSTSAIAWNLASSTTALNIEDGLLNLDTSGSKVGIGTTDPTSLFSVGSASQFQVDTNGDIVSLGGVAHTLVDTSGDLVITGNTDLAFDDHTLSSAVDLSVADAALNAGLTQGIIDAINDIYDLSLGGAGGLWLDGGDYAYLNTSLASNIQVIEDSWLGISSSTERIVFDGTEGDISFMGANIGVGTTAPGVKLDVVGAGRFSLDLAVNGGNLTSSAATFNLLNATPTTINFGAAANSIVIAGGSGSTGCTLDGTTGDLVCTGNITGSASGTVGYWSRSSTTISPATANDILSITSSTGTPATFTNTGSTDSFVVNDEATDTSPFVIDASGNVGIGTTDPSYLLEVNGDGLVGGVYLNSSDVGLTTDIDLISLANDAVTVNGTLTSTGALAGSTVTDGTTTFSDSAWTSTSAIAWDLASSTTALNIEDGLLNLDTSSNYVGIGTTAPTEKLHLSATEADSAIRFEIREISGNEGANNPSSASNVDHPSYWNVWSNVSNIYTSNDSDAYCILGDTPSEDKGSDYLYAQDFGFNIPLSASIKGIVVEIERAAERAGVVSTGFVLKNGSRTDAGEYHSGDLPTSDAYDTFGSSVDLWGTTWQPSDINASNFGGAIYVYDQHVGDDPSKWVWVDHVRITVYYSEDRNWALGPDYSQEQSFTISQSSALGTNDYLSIDTSGNVGISQTAPNYKLDITGDLHTTTSAYFATSSGNVGVGTTNPTKKLQINGAVYVNHATANTPGDNLGNDEFLGTGGYWGFRTDSSNNFNLDVWNSGTEITALTVKQDGNVGIGTTDPGALLEISSDNSKYLTVLRNDGSNTAHPYTGDWPTLSFRNLNTTDNNYSRIDFTTYDTNSALGVGAGIVGIYESHAAGAVSGELAFLTSNAGSYTEKLRITNDGNVGIGTTAPDQKLTVAAGNIQIIDGQLNFNTAAAGLHNTYTQSIRAAVSNGVTANNMFTFHLSNATGTISEIMRINGAGNVGIGTTGPARKLHVAGDAGTIPTAASDIFLVSNNDAVGDAAVMALVAGTSGVSGINFGDTSDVNAGVMLYNHDGNYMSFRTSGSGEDVRIDSNGNVGIGTTSPISKLHVASGTGTIPSLTTDQNEGIILTNPDANARLTLIANNTDKFSIVDFGDNDDADVGGIQYAHTASADYMDFKVATGIKMRIQQNGNVGIGTTAPQSLLHMRGADPDFIINDTSGVGGELNARIIFAAGYGTGQGPYRVDHFYLEAEDSKLKIGSDAYPNSIVVDRGDGYVGIGLTNPGAQLDLSTDSARKLTTNTWSTGSDSRFKTDIQSIDNALDIIRQIRPVKYHFNQNFLTTNPSVNDIEYYHFIAQEYQEIFPESVTETNDRLYLNSSNMIPYAIAGIKALDQEVQDIQLTLDSPLELDFSQFDNLELSSSQQLVFDSDDLADTYFNFNPEENQLETYVDNKLALLIKANGEVSANTFTATGSALAENYQALDDTISAGDVVALADNQTIVKSGPLAQAQVLGVATDNAGFVLSAGSLETKPSSGQVSIALAGRTTVKVDDSNGEIQVGDYLTASSLNEGHASKAIDSGWVIGRAITSQDSETSTVTVLVQPAFYNPNSDPLANTGTDLSDYGITYDELDGLRLTSKLNIGLITIDDINSSIDSLIDLQFQQGQIAFTTDGNIHLDTGVIYGNDQFRNAETILADSTEYKIQNTKYWDEVPTTINATPTWDTNVWVTDITTTGFTVHFSEPPALNEEVYWLAIF